MKNGVRVDGDGKKSWYKDDLLHREDGPAVEWPNGHKVWYRNGKLHREDGPATELIGGSEAWYRDGILHREDGPAVQNSDGHKVWYRNNLLHREDGPAVEFPDGGKKWYINDMLHREDGPAVERANGRKYWYINGVSLTEEEFNKRTKGNKMKRFKEAKQVEVHYHKNCVDGFMSAYLFYSFAKLCLDKEPIYVPVQYNSEPTVLHPDTDVLVIVDFSYSVEQTEKYKSQVNDLIFMDHHLTAAKEHGGYCFCEVPNGKGLFTKIIKEERSGAGLMFDFLEGLGFTFSGLQLKATRAVEDRDLWKFEYPDTKLWGQVLRNIPMTFEAWDDLLTSTYAVNKAMDKAAVQIEQYETMVVNYAKLAITVETVHGPMAIINCASDFASSVGDVLGRTHVFACMFVVSPKNKIVICSLRSNKETGVDVSAIAKKLGGGGHRNAAGCSFSISDAVSMDKLMNGSLFN